METSQKTVKSILAAGAQRRVIPDDYVYNPKKLKHLKLILHNINVALGTLSSAMDEFSKIKGPEISPDGLLGGIGFIIPLRDIKQMMITSLHNLSNIADCIADEMTNPRWNAREDSEVKKLIKEKEKVTEQMDDQKTDISPEDVVTAKRPRNASDILIQAVYRELKTALR